MIPPLLLTAAPPGRQKKLTGIIMEILHHLSFPEIYIKRFPYS